MFKNLLPLLQMPGGLDDYENKFFGSSSTFVGDNQNLIAVGSGVDDSPVHIYRKSDASICVLITTNDDAASLTNIGADGYINVEIDDGNDIDIIAGQLFAAGEVVLDRCFNRIDTVTITGPDTNGWKGSIMFSTDGKETYTPFVCSGCTGGSDLTSFIAVDGNGNGGVDGIANCLNGDVCTLRMSDENVSMLVCRLLATCLEDGHVELILPLFNRNRWQSILAQSGNI